MEMITPDLAKQLRILVVDDDDFALRIIRHILYGFEIGVIEEAFDGESAIEKINTQNFDILITDVEMPKLNGLGLVKAIRCGETQAPRDLSTIIITSLNNSDIIGASVSLDVNGFLGKPMKPIDVSEKILCSINEITTTKTAPEYKHIETDLKVLQNRTKRTTAKASTPLATGNKAPKSTAPAPQNEKGSIFIRDLKPGMRLQQDLYLKDGTLLLKTGYAINRTTIIRLLDLREVLKDESVYATEE